MPRDQFVSQELKQFTDSQRPGLQAIGQRYGGCNEPAMDLRM